MADNVFLCLVCDSWFPTKYALKTHRCKRTVNVDDIVLHETKAPKKPDLEERRELGKRLKELGAIEKRTEVNFMPIEKLREWIEEIENSVEEEKEIENNELE